MPLSGKADKVARAIKGGLLAGAGMDRCAGLIGRHMQRKARVVDDVADPIRVAARALGDEHVVLVAANGEAA